MEHIFSSHLLMTSLAFFQVGSNKCNTETFGEDCRYLCRCYGNVSCFMTGQCLWSGKCLLTSESGFFGPLCQYEDLTKFQAHNVSHPLLTDHDDNTCLSTGTTSTRISLKSPTPFTWFRLVMKTIGLDDKFVVSLNNGQPCQNMRKFLVDPVTIDVFCDNNILLDTLLVKGEAVSSLCSIYISGGRNVALLQPAMQISTYQGLGIAEHAVDGILRDRNFKLGDCTHTCEETDPWWQVTFRQPQLVFWVVIHNRDDPILFTISRLENVQINTTGLDGVDVHHPYNTSGVRPFYVIILEQPRVSKALTVYLLGQRRILSVCEVNIYGETWCPSGTYGLWCQHNCTCHANNQSCHPVTGQCSSPCPKGKYGFRCNLNCSPTCGWKICNERYGECFACADGYLGTFCEQFCPAQTYGPNCDLQCSIGCIEICNHIQGNCSCKNQFTGPTCDDCRVKNYGTNCSDPCPRLCGLDPCDRITGTCTRCTGGRVGNYCESCLHGFYGPMCTMSCPSTCFNQTCHPLMGICFGCSEGFEGEFCTMALQANTMILATMTIPTLCIFAFICYCILATQEAHEDILNDVSPEPEDI